jgi:hypothetical protein
MTVNTPCDPFAKSLARLLVLCARPGVPDPDLPEVRRLARPGLPWDRLVAKADDEGVLPLLYWSLRGAGADVPPEVLERLKAGYLGVLARNLQAAKKLAPFLREVRAAGLTVVLTKGLRLASTIYPDPGLRPFWDIDLVASAGDWPDLRQILVARGYSEASGADTGHEGPASSSDWVFSPYFRRGDLILEFHFNALGLHFPAGRVPDDSLSRLTLEAGGAEATIFSSEHELCYLCLHAQQHSYRRLVWLTDIARMALRPEIAWDKTAGIASDFRIRGPVFLGLDLVERLWPGTIAPGVLARFRPGAGARAALGFLWPASAVADRRGTSWPYYMPSIFSLWERRSAPLALRSLGPIFFPPRPWLARASGLPPGSLRLYIHYARRLWRPFGLAVRRWLDIR